MNYHAGSVSVLIWIFSAIAAFGQNDSIQSGAYRNSVDLSRNKPVCEDNFTFVKKKNRKIPGLYRLKPGRTTIAKKTLRNYVWGIYSDHCFFLNAKRIGMAKGYIRFEKLDKYMYFKGIPVKTAAQQERLNNSSFWFGVTGTVIASSKIAYENRNKLHYILNLDSGMVNLLTLEYLQRILSSMPDLLLQYQQEDMKDSLEVKLKYISLVNERSE